MQLSQHTAIDGSGELTGDGYGAAGRRADSLFHREIEKRAEDDYEMADRRGHRDQDRRTGSHRRQPLSAAPGDPGGDIADRLAAARFRRRARPAEDEHPRPRRRNTPPADRRRHLPRQRQGEPPHPDLEPAADEFPCRPRRGRVSPRDDRHGRMHPSPCRPCRLEHDAGRRALGSDLPQGALSDGPRRISALDHATRARGHGRGAGRFR